MAPSAGKSPPGTQNGQSKIPTEIVVGWPQNDTMRENQRPPVYNAEDYVASLKKFSRRTGGGGGVNGTAKSIYDTTEEKAHAMRSATLPAKQSSYKNSIPPLPESDCEMSLKQFGSITDLLSKLLADLRVSFPSFVQELVALPLDGVTLLLDTLRSIQLSQQANSPTPTSTFTQVYQRRALIDELACLQCLFLCCTRCPDASIRLGTSTVGLLPLAASATGQGIRSRILALQLLSNACDKTVLGHGSQKSVQSGHTSVSEALSTLRLRCGEPVRFRLLVGMLNSGGGTGELQVHGLRFINTFLESAENTQNRLYLQAEIFQAGFEPTALIKNISAASPWIDKLKSEIKRFEDHRIDIEALLQQGRDAERIRSQMVLLERRVQILQEEKSVLTTMERRLQERCAELQRDVFRLQGLYNNENYNGLDKRPVALPRQVPPQSNKNGSSEQEDEGISSSDTGLSLSSESESMLVVNLPQKKPNSKFASSINTNHTDYTINDDETVRIEDVIEELENVVNVASRELHTYSTNIEKTITHEHRSNTRKEKEIVPVNLLPQPPKRSRSLVHLLSSGSEFDGSEYGMLLIPNGSGRSFCNDLTAADMKIEKYARDSVFATEPIEQHSANNKSTTNREILDEIMDAQEKESPMPPFITGERLKKTNEQVNPLLPYIDSSPQKFDGVFFMSELGSSSRKYSKSDLMAAFDAKRAAKSTERIESFEGGGIESIIDIVVTNDKQQKIRNPFESKVSSFISHGNGGSTFFIGSKALSADNGNGLKSIGGQSFTIGSKLTDLPSGLY